ncbi:uncharacterized protein [Nicotiana tomentosiformis]|uniref:uncharacterized protein n=1 Tax=Nicotiana tomentosiformis TaxID=4098 RepID=UPI00388C3C6E
MKKKTNEALLVKLDLLEEHRDLAYVRMVTQKQMMERYYNRRSNLRYVKVRDLVLRRVSQRTREVNAGKLGPTWEEPYWVSSISEKGRTSWKIKMGSNYPQLERVSTQKELLLMDVTNTEKITIENGNPSATVAATKIDSSSRIVVPLAEKPGKFSVANFKGWQQRVFFWLITLGMQKFTSKDPPVLAADMPDNEKFMIVDAWKHAAFLCKGYILSVLEDDLYNVYSAMKTSKELWDALEKKYKTEDASLKKFVVAKFLDYKMIDNKTFGTQVQELQLIFHDLIAEGMVVNDAFQADAMIEKLPPSWRDFKNYFKHKRKEMKLEDLVIRLKIEEDNKTAEKKSLENSMIMGSNTVKETAPKSKKRKRSSG